MKKQSLHPTKIGNYCLFISILALLACCSVAFSQGKPDNTAERKYAPDRNVDILHIIIDVTPDLKERSVAGTTTIKFSPIAKSLTELRLDAIGLFVSSVTSSAKIAGYNVTGKNIIITFDRPVEPGKETTVTIKYSAFPKDGLFFRTPELGYKESDVHIFSQGETHSAPNWYPNYDYPNTRSTSEVICRVPPDMTVLSNGRLISEEIDKKTGLKAVHWKQEKPHANYLVALVAGKFEKLEGKHKNIPLAFYSTPSNIKFAETSFKNTAKIMDFLEKETGLDYPWNKYYQVTVEDFSSSGMENTTLTVLTDRTLFTPDFENIRSSDFLIAHEMAHQWFGDYVTCRDWSHLWINEGFATYYELLYEEFADGKDQMLYSLHNNAQSILSRNSEERPIVFKTYQNEGEQFDYRNYTKGGWILHMLRCQLGKDLYQKCVKELLIRRGLSSAVTEDFVSIIEEQSGRSYDRFFDQYVRFGRFPELNISYDWLQKEKLAKITIEQTQKPVNNIQIYYFPATIRFTIDGKNVDKEISIDSQKQDFYFPLPDKPGIVLFDPEYTLLAQVTFNKPRQMLYDQLADKSNSLGRIQAIEQLKENSDAETIKKLKDILDNDSFYGVRICAASALGDIKSDQAFEALAQSANQHDARVRREVITTIGSIYRPESFDLLVKTLNTEKNLDIVASCIRSLGLYQNEKTRELLTGYLKSDSFRSIYADSAVNAIRKLDDVSCTDALKQTITERTGIFPVQTLSSALDTLAYISRNEKDKTQIREFITEFVNNKNPKLQEGAIRALGTLGDSLSLTLVESFCSDNPLRPIQKTANQARDKINKEKPFNPSEVAKLAETVDKLKKDKDKLQKDFDDLKSQLTAMGQLKDFGQTSPADANNVPLPSKTEPNKPKLP
jgi:aminopeptidase N